MSRSINQNMDLTDEQWAAKIDSIAAKVKGTGTDSIPLAELDAKALAGYIDHTILKLDATEEQVDLLCEEAKKWGFAVSPIGSVYLYHHQAILQLHG